HQAAPALGLDRGPRLLQPLVIARHRDDVRPGVGEDAADLGADALGGAGDEGLPASQREALNELCHQRTSLLSDLSTMFAEDKSQVCDSSASMYIRFVIQPRDATSAKRKGLFQALVGLRDSGEAGAEELSRIDILFKS